MTAEDLSHYLENDAKVYVDVNADHFANGVVIPRSFVWEDGKRYLIDRVLSQCRAASTKAGGAGLRYTIRVEGKETFLFLEGESDQACWFMERKKRRGA
jgi:hypothetical protein